MSGRRSIEADVEGAKGGVATRARVAIEGRQRCGGWRSDGGRHGEATELAVRSVDVVFDTVKTVTNVGFTCGDPVNKLAWLLSVPEFLKKL